MSFVEINQLLAEANQRGEFLAAVVTDKEGLPVASATSGAHDPEIQAALVGLIQRVITQASDELGVANATEFTLFDANGNRFVCRPFMAGAVELVLAFLVPGKDRPYRRVMNQMRRAFSGEDLGDSHLVSILRRRAVGKERGRRVMVRKDRDA